MATGTRAVPAWLKVAGLLRQRAIEAASISAAEIAGADRIPNILSAMAVLMVRAREERRPELLERVRGHARHLRDECERADPAHALTALLRRTCESVDAAALDATSTVEEARDAWAPPSARSSRRG